MSRYHERMALLRERRGGACCVCGGKDDLHFHHRDPTQKGFALAAEWSRPMEELEVEADKCVLLCEGCHIEEHRPDHGTVDRYLKYGCRCVECWTAYSKFYHNYMRRKKKQGARRARARALREDGLTWKAVGEALGVSATRARQLATE